jgi:hypothetical protein
LKAIDERGWAPLNYVLLDHPELQETKDRVESINDIYKKQVMDGVEITDLTSLNTDKGSMGLTMDMFLDNAIQDKALGKSTAGEKKEKRRQAGILRKDDSARISAGIVVITDGYVIGPDCLAWARRTRLDKEQKARDNQMAGQLERLKLKAQVDAVLAKGATPETGKWNNHDLKVMIQWFKHDGDKAMPKNKEGLFLRYRETHTHVVHGDRGTYLPRIALRFLLRRLLVDKLLPMCLLPLMFLPQSLLLIIASSLPLAPSLSIRLLPLPSAPSLSIRHPQFPLLIVSKMLPLQMSLL